MPKFSKLSAERLSECDKRLQDVMNLAIQRVDFSVICGHRGKALQDSAYKLGKSKLQWPKSKHNHVPSFAVDIVPYPFKTEYWSQPQVWADLAKEIKAAADELGVKIRWGGDWDRDGDWKDEKFFDGPHFEVDY